MAEIVIDIGGIETSKNPNDTLKTYALGSCVAVMVYDKEKKIGGMIHIALPESSVDKNRGAKKPGYFADTGLPLMMDKMKKLGANLKSSWIKIAGGASIMDPKGVFDIGRRNQLAIKKLLWRYDMGPIAEDVGGNISRTVTFNIETGEILLSYKGQKWKL